ncbi:hypothetical protein ACWCOP_13000 [Maricaulaceae bacterium MS644]
MSLPAVALVVALAVLDDEPPLAVLSNSQCHESQPASFETLVQAWMKASRIESSYLLLGGSPQMVPGALERCVRPDILEAATGESWNVCSRFLAVESLADALVSNPVQIGPDGERRRLVSITGRRFEDAMTLFSHPEDFEIRCEAPDETSDEPDDDDAPAWTGQWRVGLDADALAQASRATRKFATLAFTDNRETNIEVMQIDAALGRAWTHSSRALGVLAYGAVNRTESDDAAADEDNLVTFGGRVTYLRDRSRIGVADGRVRHDTRFALDLSYLTDDELRAEGFRTRAILSPGLDLPGYRFYTPLQNGSPAEFAWTLDLSVLDYLEIDELGEAFAASAVDTSRYGADFNIFLRPAMTLAIGVPTFSLGYGVREPYRGDEPHLSMFTASLDLSPSKTSPFSVGISYYDGEEYDTLKTREEWIIKLGYRY